MDNKEGMNENTREISLGDLWATFRKVWYLMVIAAVVFGAAMFAYVSLLTEPTYSSSARCYVYYNTGASSGKDAAVSVTDINLARVMVGAYSEMMIDNNVIDKIKESNPSLKNASRAAIKSMITLTPYQDEMIIKVSATHTDPKTAYNIVETIMTDGIAEVDSILEESNQKDNGVSVIDHPEMATSPNSNSLMLKTLIAAVVGAIICYGIFFARTMLDHRVHSEDDLENYFDAPIISGIPIIYTENKPSA